MTIGEQQSGSTSFSKANANIERKYGRSELGLFISSIILGFHCKKVIIKQTCRGGISSARLYGGLQHKKKPIIIVEVSEF